MHIRRTIAAVALATLALTACSSSSSDDKPQDPKKLDDAASFACDDFAHGYNAATTRDARLDLAHKVNKWAPTSKTNGIAANGKILANGAAGSAGAWKLAADTFAQACLDAGWKA